MAKRRRETVHIGVLYSLTGPYGLVGREMLNGLTLAVEQVNASPEFDFQIAPLVFDPGGELETYEEHCELLIRDKAVRHIVGCYTSASRKQVLPLIERYDRLLWHSARYEGFENSDNVIYVGAAPNQHIVPLARYMIETLGTSVYCVGANYLWTWETNRVLQEIVSAAGGSIIAKRLVALGDTRIDHIVREIVERQPPIIFNTLVGEASYRFHRELYRAQSQGALRGAPRPPILSCSLCEPELRLIGPRASVGHVTSSVYFSSIDTPENRAFVRRYREMFGSSNLPSVDAEASYLCAILLARAIRRAGTTDVQAVRTAAYRDELSAPQGPVKVDPDNNHCYLTPRLARSRAGFSFEILDTAAAPVKPDPYLTWLDLDALTRRARGRPAGEARATNGLRVVK
ncbi:transporter substrate-binding domain-containing protein [Vineibacter terrae]|uniref:transporter substrate-binding domain-containing protein n=1 Tax=Vineibacter terrae TaxID=2586908 RepID=UPI002E2F87CA|nr:transporter substrate-binding domain-containing protein [Vineibacter terrae]HEX2890220.1 transporter substrate-binding domain-containing protein [Vineibacter terrae]